MRQILLLFLTVLLFKFTHAKPAANNSPIPTALYGEWYDINDGQIKLAIYDNMIIYQNSQWFLDSIETKNKNHYLLKLKDDSKIIYMDLKGQNATVKDQLGFTLVLTKNKDLCKIKHTLPTVKGPLLEKNSIWFQCYYEDPTVYPSKQTVTIRTYDYIRNQTSYIFQFISKENSVAFQLPVYGPTVINVAFSAGRKEQFYMLPGKQLIELITKDRGIKYMGDAAPLNKEMRLVKNNHLIFPDSSQFLNPYNLTKDSIKLIDPEKYSQIVQEKKAKAKSILKSIYTKKEISPITYQIEKLNIEYSYANFMLHYNKNIGNEYARFQLPYEKTELRHPYFSFLKGLDNNLGPIAPEYKNFISYLIDNSGSTDYFTVPNKDSINTIHYTIDDIIDIITPIKNKNRIFTKQEKALFDTVSSLKSNQKEKAAFLEIHTSEIKDAINKYSYLIMIGSAAKSVKSYTKLNFNWQPGILTDLCITGNIFNQTINAGIDIPIYFFKPESGYFTNKFIAHNLLERVQENKKPAQTAPQHNEVIHSLKNNWSAIDNNKVKLRETIQRSGLELDFISYDSAFSCDIKQKMIATFFKVYPKQLNQYNNKAPKHVTFIIDPEYKGIAATADSLTRFNPEWFITHPNDIDVVTHEVMHIIQNYQKNNYSPRWVTEGIADYVRLKMGLYNDESNWTLPIYYPNQRPQDGYRVTAKFFNWLEQNKKKNIVKVLDQAMRQNTYNDSFWRQETNEDLEQLWNDYASFSTNELNLDKK